MSSMLRHAIAWRKRGVVSLVGSLLRGFRVGHFRGAKFDRRLRGGGQWLDRLENFANGVGAFAASWRAAETRVNRAGAGWNLARRLAAGVYVAVSEPIARADDHGRRTQGREEDVNFSSLERDLGQQDLIYLESL
jgi:hypothetical protein